MNNYLIAPCGMNCGICLAYLRDKNMCYGCRGDHIHVQNHHTKCVIKNCESLSRTDSKFCFDCLTYPCSRLKHLDKRYRTNYGMSMIGNLEYIKNNGLDKFVEKEIERWTCKKCGEMICVHRKFCLNCKEPRPEQ